MGTLLLKALIGALIVVIIDLLSKTRNYYLAGLVVMFPVFTVITHWLIGASRTPSDLQKTTLYGALSLIPYAAYLATVYILAPRAPLTITLLSAVGVWVVCSTVLVLTVRY